MTVASAVTTLFVPASRPDRFEKAAQSGAGVIILDLEDAVALEDKASARAHLRCGFAPLPILIRPNAIGTPWHAEDIAAILRLRPDGVMLPKAENTPAFSVLLRTLCVEAIPVIALVETARGFADIRAIADTEGVARLAFGSWDYCADIGAEHVPETLLLPRSEMVLASRLANLPPPIDGVTTSIHEAEQILTESRAARSLGFGGKLTIHPAQIAPIHQGFAPSAAEVAWAEKVLASGDAAAKVDGTMVDEPVRMRARAILGRRTTRD